MWNGQLMVYCDEEVAELQAMVFCLIVQVPVRSRTVPFYVHEHNSAVEARMEQLLGRIRGAPTNGLMSGFEEKLIQGMHILRTVGNVDGHLEACPMDSAPFSFSVSAHLRVFLPVDWAMARRRHRT